MSFHVEGDYFESCTCTVSCPCIFLAPATEDACDVLFAWHIQSGKLDEVSLDGLNVVMAVHSPKTMTDGGWKAALYLDERADADQAKSLGAIFSGQAGGHLANMAPLIGTVTGVHSASIQFQRDGGRRSVRVADVLTMDVEELKGMDGIGPAVISNPMLGAVTQPIRQAKSGALSYSGDWKAGAAGANGFITEFEYRS
ncbi:MAG: DUF1326 domain-containing protein [Candidatus Dormibacteraeota bacterium]|nr:DUF1326 domain-containing protein [Candidatus Dormibacteraeota bacterium]